MMTRRGRPARIAGTPSTHVARVPMTQDEYRSLRRVARDLGSSVAGVLRDAANEFVADYGEQHVFSEERKRTCLDDS